ncbi:MAG TPA: hypothetical protein VJU59_13035, partial [Paraburkholderia sp.]|uniref:hypothetical protein n=1 Tax=Paraburkholderia sp. TaxID=1926495 RepID=UPI002B4A27FB
NCIIVPPCAGSIDRAGQRRPEAALHGTACVAGALRDAFFYALRASVLVWQTLGDAICTTKDDHAGNDT